MPQNIPKCLKTGGWTVTFMSLIDIILKKSKYSDTKKKMVKNAYWAIIGKVASMAASLFVGIIVARYLGPEQYGVMNYVISFVALFQILSTFGLDNIEIREEAKDNGAKDEIIGTAFRQRIILSIITILIIFIVTLLKSMDGYTRLLIMLYSLSVIFGCFDVIRNYFTSIVVNEYVVKVSLVRLCITCTIKIILVYLHASLIWFIGTFVLDAMITAQGYGIAYKRKVGEMSLWKYDRNWSSFLLKQAFPLLLSGAAATIFLRIDQVMIGDMLDDTSVGYFSVAAKMAEIFIFIPTILIQTVSPVLIRIKKENEHEYLLKSQVFLDITVWLCIIISIALSLFSSIAISITFGQEYMSSIPILHILAFKIIPVALNVVSGQILIIDGKQKYFVLRSISGCIICVILNYIIIPVYGTIGVAVVAIITQFVAGCLIHIFIPQYRYVFFMQMKSIFLGWKDLLHFNQLLK